jgi:hypothetical protein
MIAIFLGEVVLLEMVGVLGLVEDGVLAEEESHLVIEKDLYSVIAEEEEGGVVSAAVLRHCDEPLFLGNATLAALQSLLEGLQDVDLLTHLILHMHFVVLENYFCPLPTAMSSADLLLAAGRVVVFSLIVEDETDEAGVHLIAEPERVTNVHELLYNCTAFAEGAFR